MRYFSILFCLLILSCSTKLEEFEVPFEEEKLIVNGSIDMQTGVEIRLAKLLRLDESFLPGDGAEIYRDAVEVSVIVNEERVVQIPSVEPGRFVLSAEELGINVGDSIVVRVEKESEIIASSDVVKMPEIVQDFEIGDIILGEPIVILGLVYEGDIRLVNFEFQHNLSDTKRYFLLTTAAFFEGEVVENSSASGYILEYYNQAIELCDINDLYNGFNKNKQSVFSDICLETGDNRLQQRINLTIGNDGSNRTIDSLSLSLSYVDEIYFEYLEGLSNRGYEFQEPVFFSGNIKGGLGIIYARNYTTAGVGF